MASRALRFPTPLLAVVVAGACLGLTPPAVADPLPSGQSAQTVVDDLQAQGFNVQINWLTGYDTKPLSRCKVARINNPGNIAPSENSFTTVYVDVTCPNGDDGGFEFGVGVGLG